MRNRLLGLKDFKWRLWISLCALALIPAVYQTLKTCLISSAGQPGAFDVIGQMEWFDLIDETLLAFLTVPLYSVLNRIFKERRENFGEAVFKLGLCALGLYLVFSVGVLIYGSVFINAMNPADIDISAAAVYLRLETIAFMVGFVVSLANVVFVVIGKDKNVYILLGVRTALSLITDLLLIPRLGVNGVAISNIISNTLLSAVCILLLYHQGCVRVSRFERSDAAVLREWCRTGVFSGLQQFIDNFIYAVMVCRMVNAVAEQGNYWIANNFIWGWLLIPISALAEVIRSDCKEGYAKLRKSNYHFLAAASVALWLLSIPTWIPFLKYAQGLENADEIFVILIKLVPFYVAYAGCAIIDSIFVGLGRTDCNAINSLIVNIGYYGGFFILYRSGVVPFGMNMIILMFGLGMVVHLVISLIQERAVFGKKQISDI